MTASTRARGLLGTALAAWLALVVTSAMQHPMWRDEAYTYWVMHSAHSLRALFENLVSENHPPLWHLATFSFAQLVPGVWAWQALHVVIALVTCALLLGAKRIPRIGRIALVFGYFFSFEYPLFSRSYGLLALACVAFALLPRNRWRTTTESLLLTFLWVVIANISLQGVFLVVALVCNELRRAHGNAALSRALWCAVPVVAVGVGACLINGYTSAQLFYGADTVRSLGARGAIPPFVEMAGAFDKAMAVTFAPLLRGGRAWWNDTLLTHMPGVASVVGGCLLVLLTRKRPWDGLLLLFVLVAVALVGARFHMTAMRHLGAGFLLAVVLSVRNADEIVGAPVDRIAAVLAGIVLALHVVAAAQSHVLHSRHPFSHARAAAEWMQQQAPSLQAVVVDDTFAPALGMYLGHPVYALNVADVVDFNRWTPIRTATTGAFRLDAALERLRTERPATVVFFATDLGATLQRGGDPALRRVVSLTGATTGDDYVGYCFVALPACRALPGT